MLKADLHIHTVYSKDSSMTPEQVLARCPEVGINCIAVTDHGTIEGALKLREMAPFPVIVGEEVLTPLGEVMGLFLTRGIPSGISAKEAIEEIKAQGGLVCIPHPFDHVRNSAMSNGSVEALLPMIDVIEVFNSRSVLKSTLLRAQRLAKEHGIPGSAGSDAHTPYEIGRAYVEMPEFQGRDEFLQALAKGKVFGHRTCPLIHARTSFTKVVKRLFV